MYQHNITMEIRKNCQICNRPFSYVNQKIHMHHMKVVEYLCGNIQGQDEIQGLIKSFLFDINEHVVVYSERKKRNPNQGRLRYDSSDSDSDDYFIYTTITTTMCKPCFLYGVCTYYNTNQRLPFLRRDIFCFECQDQDDANKFDDFYMDNNNTYILPNIYMLNYYRTKQFEKMGKRLKITQK